MGYPISHIVGFDGETYDLGGGGGANIWPGAWTGLNNSKYSNMIIYNSDPLKIGDIVEVYDDEESQDNLSKRYVDVTAINTKLNNHIIINMNGDYQADAGTSIRHLSPARRWYFLIVEVGEDNILVPINMPMTNNYETYTGYDIAYDDTNITEAACKVLAGYGCGFIYDDTDTARILPMNSSDTYVTPTSRACVKAPSGRCTYIFYYATAKNTITKLSTEGIGGSVPAIPYLAQAPYNGGHTIAPLYYDPQTSAALRGWKFGDSKNFTSKSYNWFIIDTIS